MSEQQPRLAIEGSKELVAITVNGSIIVESEADRQRCGSICICIYMFCLKYLTIFKNYIYLSIHLSVRMVTLSKFKIWWRMLLVHPSSYIHVRTQDSKKKIAPPARRPWSPPLNQLYGEHFTHSHFYIKYWILWWLWEIQIVFIFYIVQIIFILHGKGGSLGLRDERGYAKKKYCSNATTPHPLPLCTPLEYTNSINYFDFVCSFFMVSLIIVLWFIQCPYISIKEGAQTKK